MVVLTFRATFDVPSRFTSAKPVGAAFGLTPRPLQRIIRYGLKMAPGDSRAIAYGKLSLGVQTLP